MAPPSHIVGALEDSLGSPRAVWSGAGRRSTRSRRTTPRSTSPDRIRPATLQVMTALDVDVPPAASDAEAQRVETVLDAFLGAHDPTTMDDREFRGLQFDA